MQSPSLKLSWRQELALLEHPAQLCCDQFSLNCPCLFSYFDVLNRSRR